MGAGPPAGAQANVLAYCLSAPARALIMTWLSAEGSAIVWRDLVGTHGSVGGSMG